MSKQVPIDQMDEFCDHLFRVLDRADLLPMRLNKAAHEFEKYGRLLAGFLTRYDKVEAAFAEWQTRTMRGINDTRREEMQTYFHILQKWLEDGKNRLLFEGDSRKDNLNHFKRSLYGRVYTWLYPRRKLAIAYVEAHSGNTAQIEVEVIERNFTATVQGTIQALGNIVNQQVIADAQAFIVAHRRYYSGRKPGTEPTIEE